MKKCIFALAISFLSSASSLGQDFRNLDFEGATIGTISDPDSFGSDGGGGFHLPLSHALPYWNSSVSSPASVVVYNGYYLDVPSLGLYSNSSRLAGEYSLFMAAPYVAVGAYNNLFQTGTVPTTARSIWFKSNPNDLAFTSRSIGHQFTLSLNGQYIPLHLQATSDSFYTWAGDIRGFEGVLPVLSLTLGYSSVNPSDGSPIGAVGVMLDDFTFSPEIIPEPTSISILIGGLACLSHVGIRRSWRRTRRT
jgi:hypothetical protein